MKIIINTLSRQNSSDICIDLIPMGIEGIAASSSQDVYSILKGNLTSPILVTENFETDFLEKVNGICPGINIFLILSPSVKPAYLRNLSEFGIKSVIYHNDKIEIMIEEIVKNIINNNLKINEMRSHIRVQPKHFDKLSSAIYIKSLKKFITGAILDISAGGFAVKLNDSLEASLLIPKNIYDPVIVSIQGIKIRTISSLIAIRGDAAGFKIDNIEAKFMRVISNYIHTRISEDILNLMKNVVS